MSTSAPLLRTVFRACVVTAVRESEELMAQLIAATRSALISEEESTRNVAQRDTASDALRLLGQHEPGLVKAYPMALLEIFAEGPAGAKTRQADPSGMDFGELSLVDDAQVQAQVELSRAQQQALHTTDAALSELNALVSAAQGLQRVQPERNPLRPENYIRALQQVVADTGVPAPVRDAWMQHLRALLGPQLVAVYQRAAQGLRAHGIAPVGYGVAPLPGAGARAPADAGSHGPAYADGTSPGYGAAYTSGHGHGLEQGAVPGYSPGGGWAGEADWDMAAQAHEALLTVGILRQLLAGAGDPYDAVQGVPVAAVRRPGAAPASPWAVPRSAPPSVHAALAGPQGAVAAAEALQDMAQLERLVGRLAQSQSEQASHSGPLVAQRSHHGSVYSDAADPSAAGAEVVARMVENMAQDSRLLAPMQRAVQNLEPAIRQLVRHDPRFFSDSQHPARRLLDELTQRSLAFAGEEAPGFSRFMRLVNEVVTHLTGREITSAAPFETVLKALQSAWETQDKKRQALHQAQQEQLLQAEQRQLLAEKMAAGIRALSGIEQVPADIMDFAAGPWAQVLALAQTSAAGDQGEDPGGYLALVPELLWSVQPDLVRADPARLKALIPHLLETLRSGLHSIDYPQASSSAFLARLVALQRPLLLAQQAPAGTVGMPGVAGAPVLQPLAGADLAEPPAQPLPGKEEELFVLGSWIELTTGHGRVRTQLTWVSPHHTLFLFTAADGSTQSMTRRMRDKLASEDALRVISGEPVVARAMDGLAPPGRRSSAAGARRKPGVAGG